MVFTTHISVFYFLPLVLLVYFNLPYRWRNFFITFMRCRLFTYGGTKSRAAHIGTGVKPRGRGSLLYEGRLRGCVLARKIERSGAYEK